MKSVRQTVVSRQSVDGPEDPPDMNWTSSSSLAGFSIISLHYGHPFTPLTNISHQLEDNEYLCILLPRFQDISILGIASAKMFQWIPQNIEPCLPITTLVEHETMHGIGFCRFDLLQDDYNFRLGSIKMYLLW